MEIKLQNEDGTIQKAENITVNQIEELKAKLPGIKDIAFLNYSYFDWDQGAWLTFEDKKFQLPRVAFTNISFAQLFSFPVISGNLTDALNDPQALVISLEKAKNIFGNQDPVGKSVLLNNHPVTIKAVIDGTASHSSIPFDGLINYRAALYFTGQLIEDSSNLPFFEFYPGTNIQDLAQAGKSVFLAEFAPQQRENLENKVDFSFFPLSESYFKEGEPFDPLLHGNRRLVVVIFSIGILILLLAVINYINLSFAGSFKRHKELAIRTISGSDRRSFVFQFFFEGILISLTAAVLSLLIASSILPWFNRVIDIPLVANEFLNPVFLLTLPVLVLGIGLISGILPAIWTTKANPISLITGTVPKTGKYKIWNYLVGFQMFISMVLIIGTITIARQIYFANNIDMGFKVNNVITLPVSKLGDKKEAFLQTVQSFTQTESFALSSTYLNTFNEWGGTLKDDGQEHDISYFVIQADASFLNTTGIQLSTGRNFKKENSSDSQTCLVNETAVSQFGIQNPLSSTINGYPIVGVVRDFHIQSLHYRIGPIVIFNAPESKTGMASIRFSASNSQEVTRYLESLKNLWEKLSSEQPFEYEFLDQRLKSMYEKDHKLMKAFLSFSVLAILIACLGLFGLFSFLSEKKIKEIGIRKVNGANVSEILAMLNGDFVKWVGLAFIIASPIAYYAMHKWLENFAYKTKLSWWIFALAGLLALGIALLTVSWQSWKAATRNPVEALRYE